jgi:hypothetical protein
MTNRAEIEALIEWWQPVLGLSHWRIRLDESQSKNRAQVSTDYVYPNAVIELNPENGELFKDHGDLEELVLHELLHISFNLLKRAAYRGTYRASKDSKRIARRQFSEQEEIVVETLARSLCLLKYEGINAKSIGQVLRKEL